MSDARVLLGRYPQRLERSEAWLDRAWHQVDGVLRTTRNALRSHQSMLDAVCAREESCRALSDDALKARAAQTRAALRDDLPSDVVCEVFALIREMAARRLGQRPYESQLHAGLVMLEGNIAEMETGEGKTLAATLPAGTAALAGLAVHVVTVNDYLARRDADLMRPLFAGLGLSVGVVTGGMGHRARQAAYACDITYCTANQLVFDYLRDSLAVGELGFGARLQIDWLRGRRARGEALLLGGLQFAIVDEVDSIFVDEARTPLIIASDTHDAEHTALVQLALEVASTLREDEHFTVDRGRRRVSLEAEGREAIAAVDADVPLFRVALYREELLTQALAALHLFRRDEQYLVRDGEVQIIDENTGRVMPGRSWTRGLHQMVEAKEKCAISPARDTLAQISYQRFFRRYRRLSGMSGTASEVRDEMWRVYRTPVVRIAPRVDSQRVRLPDRVLPTEAEKWASVTAQVLAMSGQGRPVLVGTRTVRASEALSANLTDAGISHELLNARQDADEAATVARAGQVGAVTVATNMAGRGTDIRLGEGVAARGGLHVIATERHEAGRIDRQLIGRCGRQGDPGSFEFILSLEDALVDSDRSGWRLRLRRALQRILGGGAVFAGPGAALAGALLASAQRRVQKTHSRLRRELVRSDRDEAKQLAFSGKGE